MKKLICYIVVTILLFVSIYFVPKSGKSNVEKSIEKISWYSKVKTKFAQGKSKLMFKKGFVVFRFKEIPLRFGFHKDLSKSNLPTLKNALPTNDMHIKIYSPNILLASSFIDDLKFELNKASHKFNDYLWLRPYSKFLDKIDDIPIGS